MRNTFLITLMIASTGVFANMELEQRRMEIAKDNSHLVIPKTSERFKKALNSGKYNGDLDAMIEDLAQKDKQIRQVCKNLDAGKERTCYVGQVSKLPIRPDEIGPELNKALEQIDDRIIKQDLADLNAEFAQGQSRFDQRMQESQMDQATDMLENYNYDQY